MDKAQNLKYLTIYDELRKVLESGIYKEGSKLPTEHEIAKKYNVSRPTVTKALNALRDEGIIYRKTGSGSYVSSKKTKSETDQTKLVGLIVPDLGKGEIFEPIFAKIAELSYSANFSLLWGGALQNATDKTQLLKLTEKYVEREISAVFFSPLPQSSEHAKINCDIISLLKSANIPVVLLDSDYLPFPNRSEYDLVGTDYFGAGYLLTKIFFNQGCKRVDFLFRSNPAASITAKLQGYKTAFEHANIQFDSNWIHQNNIEDPDFIIDMIKKENINNIICENDETAIILMQILGKSKLKIPNDIRIIGFDDIKYVKLFSVPLTSYRQPYDLIAEEAVRLLLSRLEKPELGARTVTIPGSIIERESSKIIKKETIK